MTASTTMEFLVQGANELDDEGGNRFQVRLQQLVSKSTAVAGAPAPVVPVMGFVIPLDFPIDAASDMKTAGIRRGAIVTIAGLAVVPAPAKA